MKLKTLRRKDPVRESAGTGEGVSSVIFALLSFLLPATAAAGAIVTVGNFDKSLLTRPEVQLPIVLIATTLSVIGGLTFMVIVLSHLRLTTRDAALGMPDGSIRAVIAISLLFLFMILSVFLYENMATSTISANQTASGDIAKQLVTTVATLAVSVAGFYFGTSSVAAATRAVSGGAQPSLTVASPVPAPPMKKDKGTELSDIRVIASPADQSINWRTIGDADGQLIQTSPGTFTYRRGSSPGDVVVLEFSLVGNPDVVARLDIAAT